MATAPHSRKQAAAGNGAAGNLQTGPLIDGKWTDRHSGKTFAMINPATEEEQGYGAERTEDRTESG